MKSSPERSDTSQKRGKRVIAEVVKISKAKFRPISEENDDFEYELDELLKKENKNVKEKSKKSN